MTTTCEWWTAGLDKNTVFTRKARSTIEQADKVDEGKSSGLLVAGSEATLRGLAALPEARYLVLSYLTGPNRYASEDSASQVRQADHLVGARAAATTSDGVSRRGTTAP